MLKFKTINNGKEEVVIGRITEIPISNSVNFLNSLYEYSSLISEGYFSEEIIKNCIVVSNKLYLLGGITSTVIDLLVNMANTIMEVETDNDDFNDIVTYLLNNINKSNSKTLQGWHKLHEHFFMSLLLDGNVFPLETWEWVSINNKKYYLPTAITFLNPLNISISPADNMFDEKITYSPSFSNLGIDTVKKNDARSVIEISPKLMKRVARRSRDYFFWGIPFLTRAFTAIAAKERLKQLDEFTTQGLISLITIFSLYDEKTGTVADSQVVNAFADMLEGRPGQARYLTWGGQVKVVQVGTNGEILKYDEKYHSKDKDISEALGCPMFLINGEFRSGASGADYAVKPFKAHIYDLQKTLADWWNYLLRKIAEVNNINVNLIECRNESGHLDNDAMLVSKIDNMRDRGLISDATAALKLGVASKLEKILVNKEREKLANDPSYHYGTPPITPYGAGKTTKFGGDGPPKKAENPEPIDPVKQLENKVNYQLDKQIDSCYNINNKITRLLHYIETALETEVSVAQKHNMLRNGYLTIVNELIKNGIEADKVINLTNNALLETQRLIDQNKYIKNTFKKAMLNKLDIILKTRR